MAMAAANWIMSAVPTLYCVAFDASRLHVGGKPAFSDREHSSPRIKEPSQPLLTQSWKGARMAPRAVGPQPWNSLDRSEATADHAEHPLALGLDDEEDGDEEVVELGDELLEDLPLPRSTRPC